MSKQDENTPQQGKGDDPRVIDFTAAKKKKKQPNSQQFFQQKNWNIRYKTARWDSGSQEKVGPKSVGNAGYRGGAGKQAPFFNFSKIPAFTRFIVLAFVLVHVTLAFIVPPDEAVKLYQDFSFIPAAFSAEAGGLSFFTLLSPISHMFLHADWVHLAFNSLMMIVFGTVVERRYGARLAALLFFAGGLAGAFVFWALHSAQAWPLMGASAGISALFGAALLMMDRDMRGVSHVKRPHVGVIIGLWIAIMVVTGLMGGGQVAWPSHLGGFLTGLGLFEALRRGYIRF